MWGVVVPTLLLVGVGVGVATGAIDTSGGRPSLPAAVSTVAQTSAASSTARATFAILRREQNAADELPADLAAKLERSALTETHGLNPALARRAATDLGNAWVIPGNDSTCLVLDVTPTAPAAGQPAEGGATCATDAQAAEGTLTLSGGTGPDSGKRQVQFVAGVVPDGVDTVQVELSDGTRRSLSVHDNVYSDQFDGTAGAATITYQGPSGPTTIHP